MRKARAPGWREKEEEKIEKVGRGE